MLNFVNWDIFAILLLASLVGAISVRPLNKNMLNMDPKGENDSIKPSITSLLDWGRHMGAYAAIMSTALIFGFYAIERLGILGAPFLEMWLVGNFQNTQFSALLAPCIAGLTMGAIVSPLSLRRSEEMKVDFYKIALWKRLIAGVFHGGIVEELLFRWCVLSLTVWFFTLIFDHTYGLTPDALFWAGNLISAVFFGVAHLPGSAAGAPLTPLIAVMVVGLNILVGLVCGYFFWIYGIEAAILAHMLFHIGMQPCSVLLRRFFYIGN